MTPEMIRAALSLKDVRHEWSEEHGAYLVSPSEMNDYAKLHFGACEAAKDYSEDCEPLPVDEAWLKDLGFRWRQIDCNGQCLSLVMHDDKDESPDHVTLLVWNDDGSWGLWGKPRHEDVDWETMPLIKSQTLAKTRPQLRQLLDALGGAA